MKVFLTGANGFVGSHILDLLRERGHEVRILLRPSSNTAHIAGHLSHVEVRYGSLDDPDALRAAVDGTEAVIHCAGKTKVLKTADYYRANRDGTRRLVQAVGACGASVRHLVHISSRAVSGPGSTLRPAQEDEPCRPVSEYGKSKLAGEREVTEHCRTPWTVVRPSAVYGPRDTDFLHAFRAVRRHVRPLFSGGRQELSLVYVLDVAEAVLRCLDEPKAFGRTYFVASPMPCTSREFLTEVTRQMGVWALPLPLPTAALWPVCAAYGILSHMRGKPSILSRQKFKELRATGWVCSVERIREELGFAAPTTLEEGVRRTIRWYRQYGWL